MDTVILPRNKFEKSATVAVGVVLALVLTMSQSLKISANDLNIGTHTGFSPGLNSLIISDVVKEMEFNNLIENKYQGADIVELEKGLKHVRMIKYFNNKPVRINVVEISTDLNNNLIIKPTIASDVLTSRLKISNIAKKQNAIVAINAGYFKPQTGVPLGTLMISKKFYTGPIYNRVAMGFFDKGYQMARVQLNATVETNIGGLKIDNVNQPRMLSTHTIVYTRDWGENAPISPKYGAQLVVKNGKLVKITSEQSPIPNDGFVIVGPAKKLDLIKGAKNFKLVLKTDPEWRSVNHIISGGPYLVKDGEIYIDTSEQKLSSIGGRNPRTAIGYTKENHLIMLTADGREGASIGLTLSELAHLMKEFGCINAMNLDGGGSTVMYVDGSVVNKPVLQGGIPLSHALLVYKKDLL